MNVADIERSEFNLLGALSADEFLSVLEGATPVEKKKLIQKVQQQSKTTTAVNGNGSRAELQRRFHMLPQESQKGLINGSLQAVDIAYYAVKPIGQSKTIKMFMDDDNKVVGLSNISSGKLEKGNQFLLYGIQLLGGIGDADEPVGSINFGVVPDYIRNGEFEFEANNTLLIPPTSCEAFNSIGKDTFQGMFLLDNPKIINDQQSIELNIDWATNAPAHSYLKVILRGTAVIKA